MKIYIEITYLFFNSQYPKHLVQLIFLISGSALRLTMTSLRSVMDVSPLHLSLEVTKAPKFPSSSLAPPTSCISSSPLTRATLTLASAYVTKVRAQSCEHNVKPTAVSSVKGRRIHPCFTETNGNESITTQTDQI